MLVFEVRRQHFPVLGFAATLTASQFLHLPVFFTQENERLTHFFALALLLVGFLVELTLQALSLVVLHLCLLRNLTSIANGRLLTTVQQLQRLFIELGFSAVVS